jgi:hypothetical protein
MDRNANSRVETLSPSYCSIPEACFQLTTTTAQITSLLNGGQVPSSVQLVGSSGFAAVRIDCEELRGAIEIFIEDRIGPQELVKQLDLKFGELKTLRQLHLHPRFLSPPGHPHCPVMGSNVLSRFMEKYQTATSAALHADFDEKNFTIGSRRQKPSLLPKRRCCHLRSFRSARLTMFPKTPRQSLRLELRFLCSTVDQRQVLPG